MSWQKMATFLLGSLLQKDTQYSSSKLKKTAVSCRLWQKFPYSRFVPRECSDFSCSSFFLSLAGIMEYERLCSQICLREIFRKSNMLNTIFLQRPFSLFLYGEVTKSLSESLLREKVFGKEEELCEKGVLFFGDTIFQDFWHFTFEEKLGFKDRRSWEETETMGRNKRFFEKTGHFMD